MSKAQPTRAPKTRRNRAGGNVVSPDDTEPPSSVRIITGQPRVELVEIVDMSREAEKGGKYTVWRMIGDVLTGFQRGGNPGYALAGLLAVLLTISFAAVVGSFGLSTLHVPTWVSRFF